MSELLTLQDLANGHLDVKALGEAANGDENTIVTTRTGNTYPSAERAINIMFQNGGLPAEPFVTKASMTASALADGKYAQVTDDTVNNGLYIKTAGVWVKSEYDPFLRSSNYTDTKLKTCVEQSLNDESILKLQDKDGNEIVNINASGGLQIPRITGDVQDYLLFPNSFAEISENTKELLDIKDSSGVSFISIANNGDIYLPNIAGSLQSKLLGAAPTATAASIASVSSQSIVGKAVYAELPKGYTASTYQWFKDGTLLAGESKSHYTLKSDDLYADITVNVLGVKGKKDVLDNSGVTIGGIAIDGLGEVGSIYEGFKLSAGDDFTELDIIAPHKPLGRWFTTRTYLAGARGSDSLLGTMYDTDPYHLGYNDSNRGVPVGYDNMFVKNSVLTLGARAATNVEKKHFQGSLRNEVAAMVSSAGAFSMYIGAGSEGENILEFKVRYSLRDSNPPGWHPSLWTQSSLPTVTYNSNEWDITEGTHWDSKTNYNEWGADGNKVSGKAHGTTFAIYDGLWHTVSAKFSDNKLIIYLDGVSVKEITAPTNSFNEPAYALISNHIYKGNFSGSIYDKAEWDRLIKGATIEVDYIRLWRKASKDHVKPIASIAPVNISYGDTGTITLPSKQDLWGRTDVFEHVQTVMTEENEPAGHHTQAYDSLPSFITYDSMTRTATINTAGQKSGRLNFVIYGYLQDGSTCEPARTYVNVAPRINVTSINITANAKYDLYAACDCGVLVTDGVKRTKVINVSGLPAGASYNDNTGFIYSNNATSGTYALSVQCINSVGQSTTKSINLVIA